MNEFLPQLKKLQPISAGKGSKTMTGKDVFFMIKRGENDAYIIPVDKKMKPVEADFHYYNGDTAQLLRSIATIKDEMAFQISWNDECENNEVSLTQNPHLLYQLIRCKNIVDEKGNRVTVCPDTTVLQLSLRKEGTTVVPTLVIAAESDAEKENLSENNEPVSADEGNISEAESAETETKTTDIKGQEQTETCNVGFLSDCFVIASSVIYPIASVGDNYRQLNYFLSSFSESMLEQYLSVFFSFIENVQVVYEDYEVEFSENDIVPTPSLSFEKIDADKTLFLRLTESVKGLPLDFVQQFDLSMVASLSLERKIKVKRLSHLPIDDTIASLRKEILQYAPNKTAQKDVYVEDNLFIIPEETAGPFLLHALPQLLRTYQLVGAEKLRQYKVKPVMPKLNINFSSGIDFLEGDATLDLDNEQFTLQQILQQYNSKKYIQLSDGNRAIIEDGYMRKLERIFKQKKGKDGKVKVSFFDLPEIEDLINGPLEGDAFKHHREVYEGFNHLAEEKLNTPKLQAKLRPYQSEGIKWIKYLYDNNLGGCLADDMGLGKTVQTIGVLTLVYPKVKKPTLIVMPRSLLFNWQNELLKFAPQLSVYTYYAGDRDIKQAMKHQVILTTYAIVRNDIKEFSKKNFHYVILDESQNIKNMTTQTTQAALLLHAEHRLALSGTPVENNLTELYSLFRFLNPTMFGTLDDFNSRYATPIQRDNDKDTLLSLRKKIFPFMLRRLKKDVLKDLPDRIEQTLYVEMNQEQHDFYERRRQYYFNQVRQTIAAEGIQKSQFIMFQALNELRRIASIPESLSDNRIKSPKLDLLTDTLLEAVANGHKVVVFFNFIAGIEQLSERLDQNGIDYACMTGSTRDRRSIVERFQNDPQCRVMLMTLKTGGVGLNLTAADTVFIFEPWWNKAAEEQAINRLHRFGQKAKVLSYSLITQQTIEEKIQLLQQQKAELFEGLIGADSSSSKQLSEEDINFILG